MHTLFSGLKDQNLIATLRNNFANLNHNCFALLSYSLSLLTAGQHEENSNKTETPRGHSLERETHRAHTSEGML